MKPNRLPKPIRDHLASIGDAGAIAPSDDNGVFVSIRRSDDAPYPFAATFFDPIDDADLDRFCEQNDVEIPPRYAKFLASTNGAEIYRLSLYGAPLSMLNDPPLLDRNATQPLCLATANRAWKYGFTDDDIGFHFGAGDWNDDDEQIGYFLSGNAVLGVLNDGQLVSRWSSFDKFLTAEVLRLCDMHADYEAFMNDLLKDA
ncbi:MAG: SMI1/KNR4 family protein [Rubripirellula sp.]